MSFTPSVLFHLFWLSLLTAHLPSQPKVQRKRGAAHVAYTVAPAHCIGSSDLIAAAAARGGAAVHAAQAVA